MIGLVLVFVSLLLGRVLVGSNRVNSQFDSDVIVNAEETKEWWEMVQLDEPLFEQFKHSRIMMRSIDIDETKIHSCYEYKVIGETGSVTHTDTFCYPAVIITGYRKSSTSALYNLLAGYPRAKVGAVKENCAFIGDRSIVQYFDSLPRSIEAGEIIFDGCVDLKGNVKMRSLLREPNTYYIVLIRDFANWLWSAYNYWCQPDYDPGCFEGDHWTNAEIHHRSPETFHDIVMGSINGTFVPSPLLFKQPCEEGKVLFQRFTAKLWANMPMENTILLASEDLEAHPEYVWSRIAGAIGLDAKHPKLKAFTEVRYNTQVGGRSTKGADVAISAEKYQPGVYSVSKFQPMLEATRKVLDQCWRDDCLWSSLVTGHKYAACQSAAAAAAAESGGDNSTLLSLAITPDAKLSTAFSEVLARPDAGEASRNTSAYLSQYFTVQADLTARPKPFLQMPTIRCEENFNQTVVFHSNQKPSASSSSSSSTGSKAAKTNILLLSTRKSDRTFVRNLIYYSTGVDQYVDVDESSQVEGHVRGGPNAVMGPSGVFMCSGVDPQAPRLMVGTDPKNVRVVPKEGSSSGQNTYVFKTPPSNCDLGVASFDYVVFIVRDSLAAAWSSYQRSLGFMQGLRGEDLVHFDWAKWEAAAIPLLLNSSAQHAVVEASSSLSEASDIIFKIKPAHKLIFRIEDLMFSAGKITLLRMIINFPVKEEAAAAAGQFVLRPDARLKASPEAASQQSKQLVNLNCAHLLSTRKQPNREAFTSRTNIDQAYASDDLLCKVKKLYENSPLSLLSLQLDGHNTTCVDGVNVSKNILRKCKVRYEKSAYLAAARMPAVLLTMHSGDAMNTRLVIEHATGAYSGAMETNRFLIDLFPGEQFCGQRMSVVYAKPQDVTIKNLKSGPGTVSLPTFGKRKCMRGSIRGFSHALVVGRDPFMSVWREFHKQLAVEAATASAGSMLPVVSGKGGSRGGGRVAPAQSRSYFNGSHAAYPPHIKARLLNISRSFHTDKLEVSHAFERLQFNNFDPPNALIVSFEALINEVAPPPVLHIAGGASKKRVESSAPAALANSAVRYPVLRELLSFAHFPDPLSERLECAFKFMEIEPALLELQTMNSFFLSHPHLICEMNQIFSAALTPNKFKFIRLYSDVPCSN